MNVLCQFERVIFPRDASASTSGFMIAVYKPCGILRDAAGHILDRFKAVGYCLPTSNKIKYKMEGRWSKSPKHGIQFEVERYEEVISYIHSIQTNDAYTFYTRSFYVKNLTIQVRDRRLGEALQYIIPNKRSVLLLSYFGGYTDTEVANILGISPTSVARRKQSGLIRLRELMEAWFYE